MPAPSTPVRFDTLLAALSSRFVNLPPGDVDGAIDDALRLICEPLGVDFAALWEWPADESRILTLTHCYIAEGGPPAASHQREEHFPWVRQQVQAGLTVALSSIEDLPAEAAVDRANGERLHIKSALGIPLSVGGSPPTGILGFNTVRAPRVWSDDLVEQLQLVAQVFANALARKRHDLSLRKSEARLEAAAELAGLGFTMWTSPRASRYFDERLKSLLGTPPERLNGLGPMEHFLEHVHPEDRPLLMQHRAHLHDGTLDQDAIEYRYLHPTQGEKWIRHVARIGRRDAAGWVLTSYGVIRDISERRQRRGGAANVVRGDRTAEGPPRGRARLSQGGDRREPPARGDHRAECRHPEGAAAGRAGRAHPVLGARAGRDRHGQGAPRPVHPPAQPAPPTR